MYPDHYLPISESGRSFDRADEGHDALLQVSLSDRHPMLINTQFSSSWVKRESVTEIRELIGEDLNIVHQINFSRAEIAIAFDAFDVQR